MDETGRPYEPKEPEYERAIQETPESLALEEEIIKHLDWKIRMNKLREVHHEFVY